MSTRTRAVLAAATLVVAAVLPMLGAGPAQAATYRYWTYWWGDSTATAHTGWKFASVGAGGQNVSDQDVLGWRFATTSAAGTTKPRTSSSYASLCSDAKPGNGDVRVAVVVDFGSSSDWPPSETPPVTGHVYTSCVTVPSGSRATVALAAAKLSLRLSDNGLVCGVDGFPATECAPIVSAPSPSPSRTATRTPTPKPSPTAASSRPASGAAAATTAVSPGTSTSAVAPSAAAASSGVTASTPASALAGTGGGAASPTSSEPTLPATTVAPVAAGASSGSSSAPWGAVGGVLLVAGVGGAAWWTMRRGGTR